VTIVWVVAGAKSMQCPTMKEKQTDTNQDGRAKKYE